MYRHLLRLGLGIEPALQLRYRILGGVEVAAPLLHELEPAYRELRCGHAREPGEAIRHDGHML